jgi:ribonuclease P protein component
VPAAPRARSESLPRRETLRRSADYQSCYRWGGRRQGALVTLHFRANQEGHPRLGVTASRKVGRAVVRQRLKRWTRELFRRHPQRDALAALDLVVHFKPPARAARFADFSAEFDRLLAALPPQTASR